MSCRSRAVRNANAPSEKKLIIAAARELAETEGWEAVTTRRLAEEVEYSQPVLYSHFKGKDAIVTAVALEGITDLAAELHAARTAAHDPAAALAGLSTAYVAFAEQRPALYEAMFSRHVDLPFATPEAPPALKEAFGEFVAAVRPYAHDTAPRDAGRDPLGRPARPGHADARWPHPPRGPGAQAGGPPGQVHPGAGGLRAGRMRVRAASPSLPPW
ncbi:TetR/AcrR family transcriptional regulator [Nonomuraea salmonea]|uniref:TetR/AcrR family transcriptional regulator n=1 Tax=Nonomuraea salmonea TaxID=46181 RepID=UPI0031ED282A